MIHTKRFHTKRVKQLETMLKSNLFRGRDGQNRRGEYNNCTFDEMQRTTVLCVEKRNACDANTKIKIYSE